MSMNVTLQTVAMLGLSSVAMCTPSPVAVPAPVSQPPAPLTMELAAPETLRAELLSCSGVGAIACDMSPRPEVDLCQPAQPCLETSSGFRKPDGLTIQCTTALYLGGAERTAFSPFVPAPPGSGVQATSVVNLLASKEYTSIFDASYLVASFDEGHCLVDCVHEWEMSRQVYETTVASRWEVMADGFRLHLEADRVLHEELDEGQDIYDHHCELFTYAVSEGRFTRTERRSLAGYCPSVPASQRTDVPDHGDYGPE